MAQKKGLNSYELVTNSTKGIVEVLFNDLVLARKNMETDSFEIIDLTLSASTTSVRANVNNAATVQLTVTNPSSKEVDFNLSSSGKSAYFQQTSMTVSPNSSVKFAVSFKNISSDTSSTITISGEDISSKSVRIQLRTYF